MCACSAVLKLEKGESDPGWDSTPENYLVVNSGVWFQLQKTVQAEFHRWDEGSRVWAEAGGGQAKKAIAAAQL